MEDFGDLKNHNKNSGFCIHKYPDHSFISNC